MQLNAQQVFRGLDPYRVVSGLKLPLLQEDDLFVTYHPTSPEHKLQIAHNEFVGMDYDSPTPACNVFDFLALHLGSYTKAVDYAIEEYHNLAQMPTGLTLESIRGHMVSSLQDDREKFEEILNLREPLRRRDPHLLNAYLYCRSHGLSPDHAWRIFYIVQGSKLNSILHYSNGHVDSFGHTTTYLVYPFMKNRHTFAMLQVRDMNNKVVKVVKLNPCQHMFFGLHSCLPGNEQTQVFEEPEDALTMHSYAMQQANFDTGFVSLAFDADTTQTEPNMKEGIFMAKPDTDFNVLAKNRSAFEEFYVGDYGRRFGAEVHGRPWLQYAVSNAVNLMNADRNVTPRVSAFVESLKGDQKACNQLIYFLEQQKQFGLLEQVKKQVDTRQIFAIGNMRITETPTGYVASRTGTNVSSHFTNFLIKIDVAIWFEDSEETYYSGRIAINNNQVPFLISSADARIARRIISEVEQAVGRAGLSSENNTPTVTDTTLSARLVDIIAAQMNNKPRRSGIQRLGWNMTRSRFITPTWETHNLGLSQTSRIIHPESTFISKYFNPQDYPAVSETTLVTPQARYLLALVVASMTRSFLNQETPTTMLIRSENSLALLAAVFRPLGQIAPIELNPNRRLVLDTLSARHFQGYPVYATCPDVSAVDNFNFPLFLLSDSGFPLHEPITRESALQITGLAHKIFTALTIDIARDNIKAHSLIDIDEAPPISELALEGKRIIQSRCGIEDFSLFEPKLPLMQAVLSNVPSDKCNDFFRYDLRDQAVYIRCRLINHIVTRQPLYDELVAKNPEVKLHNDHYIACPFGWFDDLLASFYGKRITLYQQAPDSGPATEAQDDSAQSAND